MTKDALEQVKKTGEDLKEGSKKLLSKDTLIYVGFGVGAFLIGVLAMQAWFGDKPSLATYVLPNTPVPPDAGYMGGNK